MKKYLLFRNRCVHCGKTFKTLSDPGNGTSRLLLSQKEHIPAVVYCDAPVFMEVARLLEEALPNEHTSALEKAETFDKFFGSICDPAKDGSLFDMSGRRFCPTCRKRITEYGPTVPPEYSTEPVQEVPHSAWDRMSQAKKHAVVSQWLEQQPCHSADNCQ